MSALAHLPSPVAPLIIFKRMPLLLDLHFDESLISLMLARNSDKCCHQDLIKHF